MDPCDILTSAADPAWKAPPTDRQCLELPTNPTSSPGIWEKGTCAPHLQSSPVLVSPGPRQGAQTSLHRLQASPAPRQLPAGPSPGRLHPLFQPDPHKGAGWEGGDAPDGRVGAPIYRKCRETAGWSGRLLPPTPRDSPWLGGDNPARHCPRRATTPPPGSKSVWMGGRAVLQDQRLDSRQPGSFRAHG